MGNHKDFLVLIVCGLPLLSPCVPFDQSSVTETATAATEQCQCCCMTSPEWTQLTCALFNGVDISVATDRGNLEISVEIRTALLKGTVVPLLLSQPGTTRLEKLLKSNHSYHYHPRLTAAIIELGVDDQNQHYYFLSVQGRGAAADNRHHAEARSLHLLSFLNETGELEWPVKYINISNSPCKECARDLIKAFKGKEKPTINFLWVYGSPSSLSKKKAALERIQKLISAIEGLYELVKAGFKIGLWDWKDFSKFLESHAPTERLLRIFTNSIREYTNQLNARGKATVDTFYMTKFLMILATAACLVALLGFVWWHRTHSYGV